MCGKTVYVDEETLQFAREAIEVGLDNPCKCDVCQEAYDESCLRRLANRSKKILNAPNQPPRSLLPLALPRSQPVP